MVSGTLPYWLSSRSPLSLVAAWRSRARLRDGGPLGSGPQPGSLRTDGGWILYFTDQAGLWLFGYCWPTVGWTGLGLFTLGCLVALAWVLRTCEKWCSCLGCCCRRNRPAALPPVVDAALPHLPVTPSPAACQRVSLVGRNGGTPVDTEYYQCQVRGRAQSE